MSSTSEGPLALLRKPFFFKDTIWLGGKHDGYPLVPVQEYLQVRRASDGTTPRNVLEMARETQCHLTFGLLEGALEIKIPESTMLRQNDRGETVMHSDNLDELLWDCRYRIQQLDGERNASNGLFACRRHWSAQEPYYRWRLPIRQVP